MNRILAGAFAAIVLLAGAPAAFAQAAPSPSAQPSPQRLELARQVIDATGVRKSIEPQLRTMLTQMGVAPRSASDQALQEDIIKRLPKMIDALTTVYAQVYTEAELTGILDFYRSQAGQAMVAKAPQLAQAVVPAMVNALMSGDAP
jgi:hypothetical protein